MNYEQKNQYIPGDFYRLCDICGRKIRSTESRKMWNNLIVCQNDWEPRHPQEELHTAPKDKQSVKDARPRPEIVVKGTVTQEDL